MKSRELFKDEGIEILVWASIRKPYPQIHHMVGSDHRLIVNESWDTGLDL